MLFTKPFERRMPMSKTLYSIKEAADLFFNSGISKCTLYNLVRQHKIGCIRIGRKILIPRDDLDKFYHEVYQEGMGSYEKEKMG